MGSRVSPAGNQKNNLFWESWICGKQCHSWSHIPTVANHLMQTCNRSPLQLPPEDAPPPLPPSKASGKAQWTEADEIALIDYITKHKAEASDGMKFKSSFWSGAAKEMALHSTLGDVKTPQGCSSKWDWVCTKLHYSEGFYSHKFIQLKKSHNVIATLKANTSGFNWSEMKGLNITINEACAWNEYITVCTASCVIFFTELF